MRWTAADQPNRVWRSALATAVVFGLLLLYVVPFAVLLGSVRVIRRRLVADGRCAVIAWPANTANVSEVVNLLWRLDMRSRCLLALSGSGTLGLTGRGQALRSQVDSLAYPRVLEALAKAAARGVDPRIVDDRRGKERTDPDRPRVWQLSEPRIAAAGLTPCMIPRTTNSSIAHNKFFVLLHYYSRTPPPDHLQRHRRDLRTNPSG